MCTKHVRHVCYKIGSHKKFCLVMFCALVRLGARKFSNEFFEQSVVGGRWVDDWRRYLTRHTFSTAARGLAAAGAESIINQSINQSINHETLSRIFYYLKIKT
jgi:hypothetical protein